MSQSITLQPGQSITVTAAGTTPPKPPVQPAASPLGMRVQLPGLPLYDGQGNAYALTANPGQIAWSGWDPIKGQLPPVTVTSSADVVWMQVDGVTPTNPSGVVQANGGGGLWTVAQGNAAGVYIGPVPAPPPSGNPPATIPYSPGKNPFGATFGTPLLEVDDWTEIVANATPNGSATSWATLIPSPGGGMFYEYSNPERQVYTQKSVSGYEPFTINPDGSVTITARPATTPIATQDYYSGCLCSAGSGGTAFAIPENSFFGFTSKWDKLPDIWPAGWGIPINNNFQYIYDPVNGSSEFDCYEFWQMMAQFHCGIAGAAQNGFAPNPVGTYDCTVFNNYGCYWNDTNVGFYLNGVLSMSFPTPPSMKGVQLVAIANLAVGSNNSWVDQPVLQPSEVLSHTVSQFVCYSLPAAA